MKFLVKGSIVTWEELDDETKLLFEDGDTYTQCFKKACNDIGKRLAKEKHDLLIGSYREDTVGPHVSKGANEVGKGQDDPILVRSYQPKEENEQQPKEGFEWVRFEKEDNDGPWSVALLPALQASDVVIAVGGGENTRALGVAAGALKKPIVAIPSFGGAAREIWKKNIDEQQKYYGIDSQEKYILENLWSDESSQTVLDVADKLTRRSRSVIARVFLLAAIIFLLILWTFLLISDYPFLTSVLGLLAISALIGTALRITARLYGRRILEPNLQDVLIDTSAGLLLAFILFLLYLVGAIAYPNNRLESITTDTPNSEIPLATAVLITLVGVTGAFLLDRGFAFLPDALQPFLGGGDGKR